MKECEFNPNGLPEQRVGACKGDDHEGMRSNLNVRLAMLYYNDSEDSYVEGSEIYFCDECYEAEVF